MFSSNATWVETTVVEEKGQWVVYLEVGFWEPGATPPLHSIRHRIQTYTTRRKAEIAAQLLKRNVDRDLPSPPTGF